MAYSVIPHSRTWTLLLIKQLKAQQKMALRFSSTSTQSPPTSTQPQPLHASNSTANRMQAWQIYQYGNISELTLNQATRLTSIESPNEILVKVHAASINPIDFHMMGGYGQALINLLRKRKGVTGIGTEFPLTLGRDFSGTVIQVGKWVNRFKIGDEVWGAIGAERQGTHAEFTVCSQHEISKKPTNISHLEAASIPYVAATVWSGLCTFGQLKERNTKGKRILILGGSGGIGTFTIQMLKAWGADVTVTCSGDATDLVTGLGADTAVDYTAQDVWDTLGMLPKFDVILDTVGDANQKALPLLTPWTNSKMVTLKTPFLSNTDKYGVIPGLLSSAVTAGFQTLMGASSGSGVRWGVFRPNGKAMNRVADMVQDGKIVPVVQQVFPFSEIPQAFQVISDGHLRGKIVIDINNKKEIL